jgi:hypothetical protein
MIAIKKDWSLARRDLLKSLGVGAACLPILQATQVLRADGRLPQAAA